MRCDIGAVAKSSYAGGMYLRKQCAAGYLEGKA